MIITIKYLNFVVFAVVNWCVMNIRDHITLVKNVLLKIQLDTIKLIEIKKIARSKLYQENTKHVRKSQTQQLEELNIKKEELARAMETLILKIEKNFINM